METVKKAKGHQGSWFAEVDGESYPCVHDRYRVGLHEYVDPNFDPDSDRAGTLLDALQGGRAILTKGKPDDDPASDAIRRDGYVGLFAIENARVEDGALRFTFTERICSLR